jgi:hypothetical protein
MNKRANYKNILFALLVSLFAVCLPRVEAQKIVDQILVLVNDEIITRSDLLWHLALDTEAPNPGGPVSSDILRRALDVMIDQRLIAQEALRIPSADITRDEVGKKRAELIAQFPSEAAFRQRIESVGLTPQKLNELIRQRILIDRFIEFRFKAFIFVSEQELKRYYDERLVPQIREAGQVPPPLDQVRGRINDILRLEKINQEIDRWLIENRQRADVVVLAEP